MASSTVTISEVYGGGGNSGSKFTNDFIELHNLTDSIIDLTGWSVQYASAAGGSWSATALTGSIPARGYYLVQEIAGVGGTTPLPTPDQVGTLALSSTAGKVALVNSTTLLTGSAPTSSSIVDFVGYGFNANGAEGNPAPPASNATSVMRAEKGEKDTDNNADDFAAGQPDPQNSQSAPVCFASGTLIHAARGEVPVEDLRVGDLAVTASGALRPIRWIGHRTIDCARYRDPCTAWPVRIAAHAFAVGKPGRDLFVSPAHAICVDLLGEALIPASGLVNGSTITQEPVARVTYWHVELDAHDILMAEGLPAESYLDMGNRGFFIEADTVDLTLGPDAPAARTTADFCRPFHERGPLVNLVRARLRDRAEAAGWRLAATPLADLHLVADGAVIRPDVDGLTIRFVLSAEARAVRLVSHVSAPAHVTAGANDLRRLGVSLGSLTIDDGLTGARAIALDDARLADGFHAPEGDEAAMWRWTDGSAMLPASLWDGCKGSFFLRMTLAGPALPRWVGPGESTDLIDLAAFQQRVERVAGRSDPGR